MIGLKENEVVGTAMDTIRAMFGQGKTEKLVNAILAVDKLDDLEGEYRDMVRYGIENTDYTTGRPRKRARTRKAVSYLEKRGGHFFERGAAAPQKTAVYYAELRKYNPYHDERGRFSSKNQFRTYSADRRIPKPWGENNSMAEHLDPKTGKISADRVKLYNQIINKYLAGVEPPADGKATLDYMGGGGGSGKSYTISQGVVQVPGKGKAVQINSDDIKLELPEFRQRAASDDPATSMGAANYVHEESSRIATLLTQAAMAKGLNIVVDGVASNPEKIGQEVRRARENGYANVRAHYVSTPTEVAVESSMARYYNNPRKDERRYVPPTVLRQAHKEVSANFAELAELFDSVEVVQNDRSTPVRQIARKERGGKLEVLDQTAYDAFLDKGK